MTKPSHLYMIATLLSAAATPAAAQTYAAGHVMATLLPPLGAAKPHQAAAAAPELEALPEPRPSEADAK